MTKKHLLITITAIILIVLGSWLYTKQGTTNTDSMDNGHAMTVATDQDFLIMMAPHHQEAIDTARIILERGGEVPEVKTLAQNIITTQEKEISKMKGWYLEWFNTTLPDTDVYMPMMRPLDGLSGKKLDQQFVEDMIRHHEGAISMAKQAQQFSKRAELLTLASEIVETQTKEVTQMNEWLVQIFGQSNIQSKYVGEETRRIKSLSPEDIEGLQSGSGTALSGMAKLAELNGYPGPRHILDGSDGLDLTQEQKMKIEKMYASMKAEAIPLGEKIIKLEQTLNDAFLTGTITDINLKKGLAESAKTYGELRYVHLKYHLLTVNVLTKEQVKKYNELRGYTSSNICDNPPPGHDISLWKKHNNCD